MSDTHDQQEYVDGCATCAQRKRADEAEAALAELVRLKDLKDAGRDLDWRMAEKEAAWTDARRLLSHPEAQQ